MTERIDAHHHLWRYNAGEYGWINEKLARLRRDYLPPDFEPELRAAGIDGTVAVQARQCLAETDALLAFAQKFRWIHGVIGWAPLASPDFTGSLDGLKADSKLKGLRHVVHDEPDDNYILRADFNRGVAALASSGLVYDILIFEKHLPQTIQFVDRHPNQIFVLDHIAKPRIAERVMEPWRQLIVELAKRENVYCKVSGMVTEAQWQTWNEGDLQPYWEVVLRAFGPRRLMMGSDWPVCLVASSYSRWVDILKHWTAQLSPEERHWILAGTAAEAYNLEAPDGGKPKAGAREGFAHRESSAQ
jgi:L-fuconolactonase